MDSDAAVVVLFQVIRYLAFASTKWAGDFGDLIDTERFCHRILWLIVSLWLWPGKLTVSISPQFADLHLLGPMCILRVRKHEKLEFKRTKFLVE